VRNVTDRTSNPFDFQPPCERFVPGYGDANADFHVIGDHPGIHGGVDTGVPFTETASAETLQSTLQATGLLDTTGDQPTVNSTYFSYLHLCVSPTDSGPTDREYTELEPFFDAELRAIAAHVLLPVGERATRHVFETCTARSWTPATEMTDLHATEVRGSGWLVMPVAEPADWGPDDGDALKTALDRLQATDFRRESDLGRFIAGSDPYYVR
jgi:uracil-DNA glycosylase family 4